MGNATSAPVQSEGISQGVDSTIYMTTNERAALKQVVDPVKIAPKSPGDDPTTYSKFLTSTANQVMVEERKENWSLYTYIGLGLIGVMMLLLLIGVIYGVSSRSTRF